MKLYITNRGDTEFDRNPQTFTLDCPFKQCTDDETLEVFRENMIDFYSDFCDYNLIAYYDFELEEWATEELSFDYIDEDASDEINYEFSDKEIKEEPLPEHVYDLDDFFRDEEDEIVAIANYVESQEVM